MKEVPVKNGPDLEGLAIAAALGLVAFGVSYVAIGLSATGAVAVAAVLALVVAIFLGLPRPAARRPIARPAPAASVAPIAALSAAPAAAPASAAAPMASPAPAAAPVAASKPQGLIEARGGRADDLKLIKGIGPKLEELCHSLGYYHFDQIAAWTPAEIAWVDDNLEGFKGRVTRDEWVRQAKVLAAGGTV